MMYEKRALELLDLLCDDSLAVPLSHVDALKRDGLLDKYTVSKMFHELREEILLLGEAAQTGGQRCS